MSLENSYICNLTYKYRLAVAIAVLKEKPENIPIEKYIEELRNKLKNEDDSDLTICSDDFDIDDDDDIVDDIQLNKTNKFDGIDKEINICTNFNNTVEYSNNKFKYCNDNNDNTNKDRNNDIASRYCIEILNDNNDIEISNDTRFNEIRSDTNFVDDDNRNGSLDKTNKNTSYSQNSENLLKDYNGVFNDESNCNQTSDRQTDCVNIISYNISEQHNTKEREESTQSNRNNDLDLNSTYCTSQTNYQHNIFLNRINNNESTLHINTASHNNDVIKDVNKPNNIISTINKANTTNNNTRTNKDTYDSEATELYTVHGVTYTNYNENALNKVAIPISSTKALNNVNEEAIDTTIHDFDSQATELYSVHGFTQNYTHVSQSQHCEQLVLNDKFIKTKSNRNNANSDLVIENNMEIVEKSDNINVIDDDNRNKSQNDDYNPNNHFDTPSIEVLNDHSNILTGHIDTTPLFNQNSMEIDDTFPIYAQDVDEISTYEDNTTTVKEISENTERQLNRSIEIEEVYNETEIVSFKVIEELNKVKNYINRRVERRVSNDGSTDSGYRSDSQKSTFRSSLQLSGNWLNQSAHSLYDYITQCPLLVTTQEIVNEIAQVLGQLIDKLHAEEKYPPFLEEILSNVEILLNDMMEGCEEESLMLKRDETTQRLLLLNKSIHIQKYTIEKISSILETLHSHLEPSENAYEISNTSQIENVPYIFHILELILPQYLKLTQASSVQVKESTNELKRSSLTDIWRRKWNINYTDDCFVEDSIPKKCVVVKCSEVLNKMIVSCMEGYTLISYAALHCFNMLQT